MTASRGPNTRYMTMANYRALISVPISADSDEEARDIADDYAASLLDPTGEGVVGHTEVVGESEDLRSITRAVYVDPGFERQIP